MTDPTPARASGAGTLGDEPHPQRWLALAVIAVTVLLVILDATIVNIALPAVSADLLVFGHSHIPWDTTADTGLRLVNPGSPTDRRRQPHGTFVTAVADDGVLRDVTFHPVVR